MVCQYISGDWQLYKLSLCVTKLQTTKHIQAKHDFGCCSGFLLFSNNSLHGSHLILNQSKTELSGIKSSQFVCIADLPRGNCNIWMGALELRKVIWDSFIVYYVPTVDVMCYTFYTPSVTLVSICKMQCLRLCKVFQLSISCYLDLI